MQFFLLRIHLFPPCLFPRESFLGLLGARLLLGKVGFAGLPLKGFQRKEDGVCGGFIFFAA